MRLPDSLLLSISASYWHPYDFTFPKNNGEIANRIRADLDRLFLKDISIDSDNDIALKTSMGTFYVTATGVTASGWLTELKDVQTSPTISEYSQIIDRLGKAGSSLAASWLTVRLLFRFTPENNIDLLQPRVINPVLQTILGDKVPKVTTFRNNVSYWQDDFLDTLELEASAEETEFRYNRGAYGGFDSYHEFLRAADLNTLIGNVGSFLELLVSNEPQSVLRKLAGSKKSE
jgi:hypothetical protein